MRVEIEKSGGVAVYEVPVQRGMTVMNVLDYIYAHLDHTLAYYRHSSCCQAICGRCACKLNGRQVLACAKEVEPDAPLLRISPADGLVLRDLVLQRE